MGPGLLSDLRQSYAKSEGQEWRVGFWGGLRWEVGPPSTRMALKPQAEGTSAWSWDSESFFRGGLGSF